MKILDSLLVKTSDGKFYNADLIYADESSDFAVIKILDETGEKFPVVTLGNSDEVRAVRKFMRSEVRSDMNIPSLRGIIAAVRENEKVSLQDPLTYIPKEKTFEKVLQITAAIFRETAAAHCSTKRRSDRNNNLYIYGIRQS
ncbi:MAG: hypothetical protein R3A12_14830 [Ignavibacteria bacterium]